MNPSEIPHLAVDRDLAQDGAQVKGSTKCRRIVATENVASATTAVVRTQSESLQMVSVVKFRCTNRDDSNLVSLEQGRS